MSEMTSVGVSLYALCRIAWKEGVDRGFFTYTDVMVLSDRINAAALKHALTQLCKVLIS